MSEQAEETIEVIDTEEVIEEIAEGEELEAKTEEPEEVEIYIEGEEPATSKPVPKGFLKRINKLNSKVTAANEHATESDRKLEMLQEENKLLRLKAQEPVNTEKPRAENFDTDDEFNVAAEKYQTDLINRQIAEGVAAGLSQNKTDNTRATVNSNLEKDLESHYERAETLKVTDYADTEDKAIDVLGNDIVKQIMANTDKSHLIMYHLGKNPAKAERLANLIKTNPMKGVLEIGRLESQIQTRAKSSQAPDPESKLDGGVSAINKESRYLKGATFT